MNLTIQWFWFLMNSLKLGKILFCIFEYPSLRDFHIWSSFWNSELILLVFRNHRRDDWRGYSKPTWWVSDTFLAWFLDKGFLHVILILLHPYYQKKLSYILLYFRIDFGFIIDLFKIKTRQTFFEYLNLSMSEDL